MGVTPATSTETFSTKSRTARTSAEGCWSSRASFCQMNQLHLEPGGAEEIVQEPHQPVPCPSLDHSEGEASLRGRQSRCVVGTVTDDVCVQEVPNLKVCVLPVSL